MADKYTFIFPDSMRTQLKRFAVLNGRTLKAELVLRLQATLDGAFGLPLPPEIVRMLGTAAQESGRCLEDELYVRVLDSLNDWSESRMLRQELKELRAAVEGLGCESRTTRAIQFEKKSSNAL